MSKVIPSVLQELLLYECGGLCPIPNCGREVWDIFPLERRHEQKRENLIALCPTHIQLANKNENILKICRTVRMLLLENRNQHQSGPMVHLRSRSEYLQEASNRIKSAHADFMATYIGPLFLMPDWYYDRRDSVTGLPNMDRALRNFLRSIDSEDVRNVKIILRNTKSYVSKLRSIIHSDELDKLKQDILTEAGRIWGVQGEEGPKICCIDTGFLHIPIIFKNAAIVASRVSIDSPISGGILYLDSALIENEKIRFNAIFDANYQGQQIEFEIMKTFINEITI